MPRYSTYPSSGTMTTSNVRACQACRTAKTKCDLERPVCGRCARLKHECFGYTADSDFVFRNENQVAERNSRRSRRKNQKNVSVNLAVRTGSGSTSTVSSSSRTSPITYIDITSELAASEVPWLQDEAFRIIPDAVAQPLTERVMDRFFHDWIYKPADRGQAVGELYHLPALYLGSPDNSTLKLAIQASSYAHLQGHSSNGKPLHLMARSTYGQALARMQEEVMDPAKTQDIRLLAAILALDNFETLHLGRYELLGPHTEGVKLVLSRMGPIMFQYGLSYRLWRIADARLLAKHILNRQIPIAAQLRWSQYVDTSRPDMHLSVMCVKLAVLIGETHQLVHTASLMEPSDKLDQAQELLAKVVDLKSRVDEWVSNIPRAWQTRSQDGQVSPLPPSFVPPSKFGPMPVHLALQQTNDFAYALNFYQSVSILIHDSKIELFNLIEALSDEIGAEETADNVAREVKSIVELSNTIMSAFPTFVRAAAAAGDRIPEKSKSRIDMTGRFFAYFSMKIFEQVEHVPEEHKFVARWVRRSVLVDYALC